MVKRIKPRFYGDVVDGIDVTVREDSAGYWWKTALQSPHARFAGPYDNKATAFSAAANYVRLGFATTKRTDRRYD
jgi:hypothetical protein